MKGSVGGKRVSEDDNKGTDKIEFLFREKRLYYRHFALYKSPSSKLHGKVPVGHHGKHFPTIYIYIYNKLYITWFGGVNFFTKVPSYLPTKKQGVKFF